MASLVVLVWTMLLAVRSRRDFAELEERRRKAGRLFAKGKTQAEVSRELGVSRQSTSRWYADWQAGGNRAPCSRRSGGSDAQARQEPARRRRGRAEQGPARPWLCHRPVDPSRVAEVIEATTGVSYHPGHVWKVLRQMGWSRQRPARRAVERNDEAIARWVAKDWPRVKKTPDAATPGSASRTRPGSRSSPR